jgi:multidrug efflux pump subunit AcrA (membrane-fusion protein)
LHGLVIPVESARIRTARSGILETLAVRPGDTVATDDLVASIDSSAESRALHSRRQSVAEIRAELERAQIAENTSKADSLRGQAVYERGATTRSELERLQAEYAGATATRQKWERRLAAEEHRVEQHVQEIKRFEIRSPISGIVTQVAHSARDFVNAGETILKIESRQRCVLVHLPSELLPRLETSSFRCAGTGARLQVARQTASPIPGRISLELVNSDDDVPLPSQFVEIRLVEKGSEHGAS